VVQARARFLTHGSKFDAHPFAGLAIPYERAGAHISARDFENQADRIAVRRRMRGRNKQSAQRHDADP